MHTWDETYRPGATRLIEEIEGADGTAYKVKTFNAECMTTCPHCQSEAVREIGRLYHPIDENGLFDPVLPILYQCDTCLKVFVK